MVISRCVKLSIALLLHQPLSADLVRTAVLEGAPNKWMVDTMIAFVKLENQVNLLRPPVHTDEDPIR